MSSRTGRRYATLVYLTDIATLGSTSTENVLPSSTVGTVSMHAIPRPLCPKTNWSSYLTEKYLSIYEYWGHKLTIRHWREAPFCTRFFTTWMLNIKLSDSRSQTLINWEIILSRFRDKIFLHKSSFSNELKTSGSLDAILWK